MNDSMTLNDQVGQYLAERRQAGFKLEIEGKQLQRFARFAIDICHRGPMTVQLAVRWATSSRGGRPLTELCAESRCCARLQRIASVSTLQLKYHPQPSLGVDISA